MSLEPGMVITTPAEVKHWHGAKADRWFSHIVVEILLIGMVLTEMVTALAACGNGVTEDRGQTQGGSDGAAADSETETGDTVSDSGETGTDYETDGNTIKVCTPSPKNGVRRLRWTCPLCFGAEMHFLAFV